MSRSTSERDTKGLFALLIIGLMIIAVVILQIRLRFFHSGNTNTASTFSSFEEYLDQTLPNSLASYKSLNSLFGIDEVRSQEQTVVARDSQTFTVMVSKPQGTGPFPAVIIVHGEESSQRSTERLAKSLGEDLMKKSDVITVTIDWRESDIGQDDLIDVISAVEWTRKLTEVDTQPITLLGIEYGAYLAAAATQEVSVEGLIDAYGYLDPLAEYQYLQTQNELSAKNYLRQTGCDTKIHIEACLEELNLSKRIQVRVPLLVLHTPSDTRVPITAADEFAKQVDSSLLTYHQLSDTDSDFLSDNIATGYDTALTHISSWLDTTFSSTPSTITP